MTGLVIGLALALSGVGLMLAALWVKWDVSAIWIALLGALVFGAGFVVLLVSPAHSRQHQQTYSCEQVRSFVSQYGRRRALVMALSHGISASQLRQARACL